MQVLYTMPGRDSSNQDAAIISESGAMNVFFLLDKVGLPKPAAPAAPTNGSPQNEGYLLITYPCQI